LLKRWSRSSCTNAAVRIPHGLPAARERWSRDEGQRRACMRTFAAQNRMRAAQTHLKPRRRRRVLCKPLLMPPMVAIPLPVGCSEGSPAAL